jgi:hypothetical protein
MDAGDVIGFVMLDDQGNSQRWRSVRGADRRRAANWLFRTTWG